MLTDEAGTILAGHGRVAAAERAGLREVPTIVLNGLSSAEKKALVVADNRLPEQAAWDFDLLKGHLTELIDLDFDVEFTGFSAGEVDLLIDGASQEHSTDPADVVDDLVPDGLAVTKLGDLWELGRHSIFCGDATDPAVYHSLLGPERIQMGFTDPPYGVPISGHAMGRGRIRHREFVMGSGEMSPREYTRFLTDSMRQATAVCVDGAIQFWCIDWRHVTELCAAAAHCGLEYKNLIVWVKTNAGQGSFYRSQHELIGVYKTGTAPHINNFGLGATGRYRTNVWTYPSVNSFHPARRGDLELHPTTKPVALVADAIRDCSKRNGIILDPFGGSGTTVLAAERTGRVARLIELDPLYVDVAVQRWARITGTPARHAASGLGFSELRAQRGRPAELHGDDSGAARRALPKSRGQ